MKREIELCIEKIAFGGAGFGHLEGKACFMPFAAPGDRVRGRVIKEKSSYIEAELLSVIEPSQDRIEPVCPVFGQCGGCALQHLSYANQLQWKELLFAEQLWRFARVGREACAPIFGADSPWSYRSRVQIKLRWIDNRLLMGFYRSGSHFVIPIPGSCAIAHPRINDLIGELHPLLSRSPEPERIPQVDLTVSDSGESIVIVHYIGHDSHNIASFLADHLAELPSAGGIWLQTGRKESLQLIAGIDQLTYSIPAGLTTGMPHLLMAFSRGGFSQVHYQQNLNLVRLTVEGAGLSGKERVLDLFCGNGNLTLPLASSTRNVVGVEEYEPSIADARRNAAGNGVDNVTFVCADAETEIRRLIQLGETFDVIVLDPPRSGALQLMHQLPLLQPQRIVYVSCNPVTLARDVAILIENGFRVAKATPLDMFPQSFHIESVTLLERS